jgi:hypothetical protein
MTLTARTGPRQDFSGNSVYLPEVLWATLDVVVRAIWPTLAVLFLCAAKSFAQSPTGASTAMTSLCGLAQNPEAFNGKMVRVRASAMGLTIENGLWIDDFEQKPACSAWMGVVVVLPEQVKPKPGFDAVRDDSFQQFFDKIRTMNVQATFEGHFEAVYTWKEQKRIWIASAQRQRGFGKKGRYGGRIVLYRVSDVVAHYIPPRK